MDNPGHSDTEHVSRWQQAADKIAMEKQFLETIKETREKRNRAKRLKGMIRRVAKFLFSTGGLLLLNVLYLVAGGYIFMHLEQNNELQSCKDSRETYYTAENLTLVLLMDRSKQLDGIGGLSTQMKDELLSYFEGTLQSFALSVLDAGYSTDRVCELLGTPDGQEFQWNFTSSLVFALTIITTIGYGVIAPKTSWGRLVCMTYAVLGIPLFMFCLANVGEIMAVMFRVTYSSICCLGCCKNVKKKTREQLLEEEEKARKEAAVWRTDASGRPVPPSVDELFEEDDVAEEEDEEELTVPLTIIILFMLVFIMAGASLFSMWEGWSLPDSIYYCFITFTTIGFGDLVPGTGLNDANAVIKSISVLLYIIFGMAALSMCIQMIANEIVAKFEWIKERLGFRQKEEEEMVEGADGREGNEMLVPPPEKT